MVLTSADGLNWKKASQLPIEANSIAAATDGLYAGNESQTWRSLDAQHWQQVRVPEGIYVTNVVKTPDGYVGLGSSNNAALSLMRSPDGSSWELDQGDLTGDVYNYVVYDARLVVTTVPSDSPAKQSMGALSRSMRIWQSTDWGKTWQPVRDPNGRQMSGLAVAMGDRLGIVTLTDVGSTYTRQLSWVGTLEPARTGDAGAGSG